MFSRLFLFLDEYKIKGRDWFKERAHGVHAKAWLFALSFSESSFFLIPPDILLVAILMVDAKRWAYYAALTTAGSVLGALFGYAIGALFFEAIGEPLISFYGLTEAFLSVQSLYDRNTFWVIFTAAFTPIPYKIFVLAGGLFKINLLIFTVASILGRGLRFFAVAYITKWFGPLVAGLLFRYFNLITLIVLVLVALILLLTHTEAAALFG